MGKYVRTAASLTQQIGALTPQTWSRSEKLRFEAEVERLLDSRLTKAHEDGRRELRAEILDRAALFKATTLEMDRAIAEQDRGQGYPRIIMHLGRLVNRALGAADA